MDWVTLGGVMFMPGSIAELPAGEGFALVGSGHAQQIPTEETPVETREE